MLRLERGVKRQTYGGVCYALSRMKTRDFDFDLPPERIAQTPAEPRDAARLMVLRRDRDGVEHRMVRDLPDLLAPGDLLVLNDTRVIPARVLGHKERGGGAVELLLLEELPGGDWDALLRARRRPRPGDRILLPGGAVATLIEDGEMGRARVRIAAPRPLLEWLDEVGHPPLPPYIRRDYADAERERADRARYQTIYAARPGAVAAPTAGLHFTPELFKRLAARGIGRVSITLHVGLGTFRPVIAENAEDHRMEAERYEVSEAAARAVNAARAAGGRVVAVGSTSVRTLETVADADGKIHAGRGRSDLYIRPGWRFRAVDAMLTNFHLPRSTLLMMVSALAGRERILAAYAEAIREGYRFFSYGDAMLIL